MGRWIGESTGLMNGGGLCLMSSDPMPGAIAVRGLKWAASNAWGLSTIAGG